MSVFYDPQFTTIVMTGTIEKETNADGGLSKMKKSHAMSLPNTFTRRSIESSSKLPVFTVDAACDNQPVLSASLDVATDGRYGLHNPAFRHLGVHRIPLRRRSSNSWNEDNNGYRAASPLLQLSPRSLRVSDDETASVTSSNASNDESESSDESSDSERVMSRLARKKILTLDFDDVTSDMTPASSNDRRDEKRSRGREASRQLRPNPAQAKERNHTRCLSASKLYTIGVENDLQGPRGPLFTARIFNRIGRKNGLGDILRNVSHVNHVYKGTILVTDILDGTISFVARSGRAVKEFVTETGSEPWCACITPRGHVAVTLRRQSCVTVWCGNGTLVREFGHGVLECPSGLACDRQGRFIVSDERTNQVAFFSPTGEFLGFLGQLHNNNNDDSHDNSGNNNNSVNDNSSNNGNQGNSKGRTRKTDSALDNKDKRQIAQKYGKEGSAVSSGQNTREPAPEQVSNDKPAGSKANGDVPLTCQRRTDQPSPYKTKVGQSFVDSPNRKVSWIDEMDEEDSDSHDDIGTTGASKARSAATTTAATTPARPGSSKNARQTDSDKNYTFSMPRYVCVTASDKILVSDSGSHCVKVFSPEGHFLNKVGSYGTGDGNLKVPYGICCDHDENIYIADHYNDRVSVFSLQGEFLQHVLTSASGLSRPKSLAIRPAHVRKLYVAHGGLRSNEVLVYSLVPRGRRSVSFTCDV